MKSPAFALGPAAKVGMSVARPCSARWHLVEQLGFSFVIPGSVCMPCAVGLTHGCMRGQKKNLALA